MATDLAIKNYNVIGFHLSGGADSAILFHELLEQISKDQKIILITGTNKVDNNFNERYVNNILDFYKDHKNADCIADHIYMRREQRGQGLHSKTIFRSRETAKIVEAHSIQVMIGGLTKNPSEYVAELQEGRDERRDVDMPNLVDFAGIKYYRPYSTYDKKKVASLFNEYNLTDTLFPLTWSCEGTPEQTNNYNTPCKQCWWCKERYWAFGEY